jgi:hypothetical protein
MERIEREEKKTKDRGKNRKGLKKDKEKYKGQEYEE